MNYIKYLKDLFEEILLLVLKNIISDIKCSICLNEVDLINKIYLHHVTSDICGKYSYYKSELRCPIDNIVIQLKIKIIRNSWS